MLTRADRYHRRMRWIAGLSMGYLLAQVVWSGSLLVGTCCAILALVLGWGWREAERSRAVFLRDREARVARSEDPLLELARQEYLGNLRGREHKVFAEWHIAHMVEGGCTEPENMPPVVRDFYALDHNAPKEAPK